MGLCARSLLRSALAFAGWRPVDDLEDKTIMIWSKDGVPPATPMNAPQMPPHWQGLMWGILPFGSSILAMLVVLIPEKRRQEVREEYPYTPDESFLPGRMAHEQRRISRCISVLPPRWRSS